MKRFLLAVLVTVAASAAMPSAQAQNVQNFKIKSFTADYYLDRNQAKTATLRTDEVITAEFPNFNQNHGILRALPKSYLGHSVSLKINSVKDIRDFPLKYETYEQNDNLVLKIGDKDTYVQGAQVYKINYDQKNVINFLDDHDEFYWDINGNQWQQTFGEITARIHIAPSLISSLQSRRECYGGPVNCTISNPEPQGAGLLITAQARNMPPSSTLTTVLGFNKGTFAVGPEITQEEKEEKIKLAAMIAGTLALPTATAAYMYSRWRRFGRDPKGRGVIIPEYQPPKGLNALTSDYILKQKLDNKAITALIIELAIRKYLTIHEIKKVKRLQKDTINYELEITKDISELTIEEKKVLFMFFGHEPKVGERMNVSIMKNQLSDDVADLKKSLGTILTAQGYFTHNPENADKVSNVVGYGLGFMLAFIGVFFIAFIIAAIGISLAVSGIIIILFVRYMPARSQAGVTVRDHMYGLRDYIKLAEADRLKFLQSTQGAEKIQVAGLDPKDPKSKVKLFESLLPYAMLFGLEKSWANQFKDIYTRPPDWYSGNWTAFSVGYLTGSLGDFGKTTAVAFTPQGSSSGSGFGGGFSGGGGGGGGGGGW